MYHIFPLWRQVQKFDLQHRQAGPGGWDLPGASRLQGPQRGERRGGAPRTPPARPTRAFRFVLFVFPKRDFACCQGMLGLELFAKWAFRMKKALKVKLLAGEQKATERKCEKLAHVGAVTATLHATRSKKGGITYAQEFVRAVTHRNVDSCLIPQIGYDLADSQSL